MHKLIARNRSRSATQEDTNMADSAANAGDRPARGSAPGTPRWVKVAGALALIAVVALVIMVVAGGGEHGPARHSSSGAGQQAQPGGQVANGVSESRIPSGGGAAGHTPPAGDH